MTSQTTPELRNNTQARTLTLPAQAAPVFSGHLKLRGTNPQGHSIEFTNYTMLQDGKPCIPVMGEFHFSRYPFQEWEDELLKMKCGGVNIVATYVFWIHVEEEEGVFDWSNNNNLREFVSLCGRHGLQVMVRIGPFAHGECRNGGIPDWLYGRPFQLRSNDERYLKYVKRLYDAIGAQIDGLLFKDGGPIIGVQLDNEYMHAGAPWEVTFRQGTEWVPAGRDGPEHIAALKRLAQDAGLDVPIYSCTGWLNSPIVEGEILPMQGGYAFTPWNPDPNYHQEPTREFLFRNRHLNPVLNGKPTYDASHYPYACCEIGGGIQDTYYHRPVVPAESVEALALMNLAGGANLIGYYMYHGGTNPVGKHSFMNEFTVPRLSYDFQAPIGEFGQIADSYRYLRLIHLFLSDFGDLLAPMSVVLPEDAADITLENTSALRWAVRSKDGAGFLFLNNYQDHVEMQDIPDIRIALRIADETLSIPNVDAFSDVPQPKLLPDWTRTKSIPRAASFTLQKNVSAILPFNLELDGVCLEYATAQLLTRIETNEAVAYFFFAPRGMSSEYAFEAATFRMMSVSHGEVDGVGGSSYVSVHPGTDSAITIVNRDGKTIYLVTLTREQAERATKQTLWEQARLVISDATLVTSDGDCFLFSTEQTELALSIYPPVEGSLTTPFGPMSAFPDGFFTRYSASLPETKTTFDIEMLGANKASLRFPPHIFDGVNNVILRIDYVGDIGNAFIDGKLIHDNFYNGTVWEIGLKRFTQRLRDHEMLILVTPIDKNAGALRYIPTGMAFRPEADGARLAEIRSIKGIPEYKIPIEIIPNNG